MDIDSGRKLWSFMVDDFYYKYGNIDNYSHPDSVTSKYSPCKFNFENLYNRHVHVFIDAIVVWVNGAPWIGEHICH